MAVQSPPMWGNTDGDRTALSTPVPPLAFYHGGARHIRRAGCHLRCARDNENVLTCYGHTCRLSRGELTYLAFRLAAAEIFDNLALCHALGEEPDSELGCLAEVPMLCCVPVPVQLDLLAETWAKQRRPDMIEATLLDAAVVYAACRSAGRLLDDEPALAQQYLAEGPRRLRLKLDQSTSEKLEFLFEDFWDDFDFLLLSEWQDLPPQQSEWLKQLLRFPDETPMYAALCRGRISSSLSDNLRGLLTPSERRTCQELIS